MVGQLVGSGPYVGGLNTYADPSGVADDELVVCDNFEVALDGALTSRPPYVERNVSMPLGATGNARFLGYYYDSAGVAHLVANDGLSSTYWFDGAVWHLITASIAAADVTMFGSKLALLAPPTSGNSGGIWDGTTFVPDALMPKGASIITYKSRLWIATGIGSATPTRVYYSAVVGTTPWTSGHTSPDGFFDVGGGDGVPSVALLEFGNSIAIFRQTSIWSFSYSTDPAFGVLQLTVDAIGLADPLALEVVEGLAYFMFEGRAYAFTGAAVQQLNQKVPFTAGVRANCYQPFTVSVFNRRVIFSYFDTQYVYSLLSKTWSTWHSPAYTGIGKIAVFTGAAANDAPTAITHSSFGVATGGTRVASTLFITDVVTSERERTPYPCTMRTKTYDYGTPAQYKRLFHWGASVIYRSDITGIVTPVVYASQVTWGNLLSSTWAMVRQGTWSQPLVRSLAVTLSYSLGRGPLRKFIRFPMSLRFQHVYFTITATIDGSTTTAPTKVFNISTWVTLKQGVSRAIS